MKIEEKPQDKIKPDGCLIVSISVSLLLFLIPGVIGLILALVEKVPMSDIVIATIMTIGGIVLLGAAVFDWRLRSKMKEESIVKDKGWFAILFDSFTNLFWYGIGGLILVGVISYIRESLTVKDLLLIILGVLILMIIIGTRK
jgi:hypothetical protein